MLRLDAVGARVLRRWHAGAAVDGGAVHGVAEARLARRLHDDGLVVLRAPTSATTGEVTVVVPVRDRATELDACLAGVGPCAQVLVVDDGSVRPAAVAEVAARHGARLLVRPANGGPAAARNTGLAAVRTALVAFVDSDCLLPPGWLADLLPVLLDERVAVAAPRVVGAGGRGALARYERASGPLDLGPHAGPVRSGARVGHVPAAVLLCRVAALGDGFDEALRVAEDVDLVWRLAAQGLAVRYEPQVVVRHATRAAVRPWLAQRHLYGRGAALLDQRHPGQVAPAVLGRWSFSVLALLLARRPALAVVAGSVNATVLHRRLPSAPGRTVEAARLAADGVGWSALSLADAGARVWLPVLLPAAVGSRTFRRLVVGVVLLRLWRTRPAGVPTPLWLVLRVVDDLAYGTGVWRGALARRRWRVVLPRVR